MQEKAAKFRALLTSLFILWFWTFVFVSKVSTHFSYLSQMHCISSKERGSSFLLKVSIKEIYTFSVLAVRQSCLSRKQVKTHKHSHTSFIVIQFSDLVQFCSHQNVHMICREVWKTEFSFEMNQTLVSNEHWCAPKVLAWKHSKQGMSRTLRMVHIQYLWKCPLEQNQCRATH